MGHFSPRHGITQGRRLNPTLHEYFSHTSSMRPWFSFSMFLCLVLLMIALAEAGKFSFSLPGKWGSGGKRSGDLEMEGDCSSTHPDVLLKMLDMFRAEARRISQCLRDQVKFADEDKLRDI